MLQSPPTLHPVTGLTAQPLATTEMRWAFCSKAGTPFSSPQGAASLYSSTTECRYAALAIPPKRTVENNATIKNFRSLIGLSSEMRLLSGHRPAILLILSIGRTICQRLLGL